MTRHGPVFSAASLMDDDPKQLDTLWLMHYESPPKRHRWFRGRCGTQIAIAASKDAFPPELGWPRVTATCSRRLVPSRPWVRDHVRNGAKDSEEHPSMMIDWHMSDDIRPRIEMLNAMGMNLNVTMWE
ncbi:hypothetical protein DPV78_001338 [Talaromyces pinophilus]|nr:hypothetical protein DPV78_001338 [Talaromyces pinophilus]